MALSNASLLSWLAAMLNTFSQPFNSGDLAGILNSWHPTLLMAALARALFWDGSPSIKNEEHSTLSFFCCLKHGLEVFIDKSLKESATHSVILFAYDYTLVVAYCDNHFDKFPARSCFVPFGYTSLFKSFACFPPNPACPEERGPDPLD